MLELPTGVLGGQTGSRRLVDRDTDAGPGPLADPDRNRVEPAHAAHACRREAKAGLQSAGGLGAAIHESRAGVQRADLDPQRRGIGGHRVHKRRGTVVHRQAHRPSSSSSKIRISPRVSVVRSPDHLAHAPRSSASSTGNPSSRARRSCSPSAGGR